MAEFTIKAGSETTTAIEYTPETNILINSIRNYANFAINFSEGDSINSGTVLKVQHAIEDYFSSKLDIIVDYTEI